MEQIRHAAAAERFQHGFGDCKRHHCFADYGSRLNGAYITAFLAGENFLLTFNVYRMKRCHQRRYRFHAGTNDYRLTVAHAAFNAAGVVCLTVNIFRFVVEHFIVQLAARFFRIAEADMQMRGPGDVEGTQQSGIAFNMRIANLATDGQILSLARDCANDILNNDPDLQLPENRILLEQLHIHFDKTVNWSRIS